MLYEIITFYNFTVQIEYYNFLKYLLKKRISLNGNAKVNKRFSQLFCSTHLQKKQNTLQKFPTVLYSNLTI